MLDKEAIDWSQSRIIFITPEFTKYQQQAIGFKDLGNPTLGGSQI
jgi:hypothetical protein